MGWNEKKKDREGFRLQRKINGSNTFLMAFEWFQTLCNLKFRIASFGKNWKTHDTDIPSSNKYGTRPFGHNLFLYVAKFNALWNCKNNDISNFKYNFITNDCHG